MDYAVVVNTNEAQLARQLLEKAGDWDETRRLKRIENGCVAIPLKSEKVNWQQIGLQDLSCNLISIALPLSKKCVLTTPAKKLTQDVLHFAQDHGIQLTSDMRCSIPAHWEKHGDLILLPEMAFRHPEWQKQGAGLWQCVAKSLGCSRIAQKFTVAQDGFRSPQVALLLGSDGWVEQVDNGIRYCYDVTKCMFSAGNISEKLRVASFNCRGETVVDLYSGIGYFTLPYLVHTGALVVHACEWNPAAVEALEKNVRLNGVHDRCIIHFGDNRRVCPRGLADRVNLGLIPKSEAGWSTGCAALNPSSGGILHIHANINSKNTEHDSSKAIPLLQSPDLKENKCAAFSPASFQEDNVQSLSSRLFQNDNDQTILSGQERLADSVVAQCFETVSVNEFSETTRPVKRQNSYDEGKMMCGDKTASNPGTTEGESLCVSNGSSSTGTGEVSEVEQQCNVKTLSSPLTSEESTDKQLCDGKIVSRVETRDVSKNKTLNGCRRKSSARESWTQWAKQASETIQLLLLEVHGRDWTTKILHIEHVKSYAPHVDHIVLDLECRPV